MLQQLLNSLTAKTIKHVAPPPPDQVPESSQRDPAPAPSAQPKVKPAPRSVCTSLKDLCEL